MFFITPVPVTVDSPPSLCEATESARPEATMRGELLPEPSYDRNVFSEKVDIASHHFYTLAEQGLGVVAKRLFFSTPGG